MTNRTGEATLSDFKFLHPVYEHNDVAVHHTDDEARANDEKNKELAQQLIDEVEEYGRDFPTLEIPDPAQRLEAIRIRLAVMRFEAIERKNLIPSPLAPVEKFPIKYRKADVDVRAVYREDELDGRTIGSLTAAEHETYSEIEEMRLGSELRPYRTIDRLGRHYGEGISYDYEAMNFLGIVATYLARLSE